MKVTKLPYRLWLPSWYPNKLGPFDGDFIQRHARAVSSFIPVHVFYIVRDKRGTITRDVKMENSIQGNLHETIVYYYSPGSSISLVERIHSHRKYTRLYRRHLEKHFSEYGVAALAHVHIAFKAGMIALWLKRKYNIPYLLTEQWTIYLEEAVPGFDSLSWYAQSQIQAVFKSALLVLPVSRFLGEVLKKRWPFISYEVVPNVVNTDIFFPEQRDAGDCLKLVHISTLTYQKNPQTLLRAAGILKSGGLDFKLQIIGPHQNELSELSKKLGLEDRITFLEEMPQEELAGILRKSDALILYSRYETFGCVLIEANACGIPVIVPETELMHELVHPHLNGVFVKPGSAEQLANAIMDFRSGRATFVKEEIARITWDKYAYPSVGEILFSIYKRYT